MKYDVRARALKAHRLRQKHITGEELAARMKCGPENAAALADVGRWIEHAEERQLRKSEREVFKVICRCIARSILSGHGDFTRTGDVDFAVGKRGKGWCGKALPNLVGLSLIEMPQLSRVQLTSAGWAFAWATGLIKPTWKVPP